jgi:YgiT-type zinc finger domain-containing protein
LNGKIRKTWPREGKYEIVGISLKDNYILIKNVPVGVCKKCGKKYYTANVLKTIELIICGRRKIESKIPMAVYS